MALLNPLPTSHISQAFGPPAASVASMEPAMYAIADKAYWAGPGPFPGSRYYAHFHPAVDRAVASGTPIVASESGTVTEISTDATNGNKIEVEIQPGVRYGHNHMSRFVTGMKVGSVVRRGGVIGYVGATGAATGPHSHYYVSIREKGSDGVTRTMLYNPLLFEAGGKYATDARIQSLIGEVMPKIITVLENSQAIVPAGIPLFEDADFKAPRSSLSAERKMAAPYRVLGTAYRVTNKPNSDHWIEVAFDGPTRRYVPEVNVKLIHTASTDCTAEKKAAVDARDKAWEAWLPTHP